MQDRILNICALVLSLVAIGFTAWHAWLIREHNRLSVRPLLGIDCRIDKTSSANGLFLVNKGLGPAVIHKIKLLGSEFNSDTYYDLVKILVNTFGQGRYAEHSRNIRLGSFDSGDVIEAGGRYPIITLDGVDLIEPKKRHVLLDKLFQDLKKIDIEIKYTCIYGSYSGTKSWP